MESWAIHAPRPKAVAPPNVPSARTEARLAELRYRTNAALEDVEVALGSTSSAGCQGCRYDVGHWHSCGRVEHRSATTSPRCGMCGGWPPECCWPMIEAAATPAERA